MMLSRESVRDLQRIFREEYGASLSEDETEVIGIQLVLLFERLMQRLPSEQRRAPDPA